jgi:hypothetical protein
MPLIILVDPPADIRCPSLLPMCHHCQYYNTTAAAAAIGIFCCPNTSQPWLQIGAWLRRLWKPLAFASTPMVAPTKMTRHTPELNPMELLGNTLMQRLKHFSLSDDYGPCTHRVAHVADILMNEFTHEDVDACYHHWGYI